MSECDICDGEGEEIVDMKCYGGVHVELTRPCNRCNGAGEIKAEAKKAEAKKAEAKKAEAKKAEPEKEFDIMKSIRELCK